MRDDLARLARYASAFAPRAAPSTRRRSWPTRSVSLAGSRRVGMASLVESEATSADHDAEVRAADVRALRGRRGVSDPSVPIQGGHVSELGTHRHPAISPEDETVDA